MYFQQEYSRHVCTFFLGILLKFLTDKFESHQYRENFSLHINIFKTYSLSRFLRSSQNYFSKMIKFVSARQCKLLSKAFKGFQDLDPNAFISPLLHTCNYSLAISTYLQNNLIHSQNSSISVSTTMLDNQVKGK